MERTYATVSVARVTPKAHRKPATYQVSVETLFTGGKVRGYALPPVNTHSAAKVQALTIRDLLSEIIGSVNVKMDSPASFD